MTNSLYTINETAVEVNRVKQKYSTTLFDNEAIKEIYDRGLNKIIQYIQETQIFVQSKQLRNEHNKYLNNIDISLKIVDLLYDALVRSEIYDEFIGSLIRKVKFLRMQIVLFSMVQTSKYYTRINQIIELIRSDLHLIFKQD